ncbi:DUF4349 domain-containing protein [Zongyangia hominis]|uniref:DUF4349 domain-containing protein n=1 Tax=Zongyangia hominis TaxID=2763677 RepID=A0A926E878_9FIRM|nr:DUF4349 domain-containing protein [Zongyangia hominis]MBC8569675.1 DUF4349 domain-containing protein [Zongyangia hominis]
MKRWLTLTALLLAVILVMTGCSANKVGMGDSSSSMAAQNEAGGAAMDMAPEYANTAGETSSNTSGDEAWQSNEAKIIRTIDMEVETTNFDAFIAGVKKNVAQAGGYVQNSSVSGKRIRQDGSQDLRHGSLTLRIPKDKLDEVVSGVSDASNVTFQNEYADDISLTYYDTESRKKALEIEQERLMALLEKADDIEAIIRLEERLTEVRRQLEGYTSSLKQYDNMVDYSTLNIQISEVKSVTEKQGEGFLEQMGRGISQTFRDLGKMCRSFALFVVVNLPYILILAVIVALAVFFIRRSRRRRRNALDASIKKAEKMESDQKEEENE